MIYALIPARGGSKRIPRKNMEKVGGVTLVARAVRVALKAPSVDRVFVSTDDDQIEKEARANLAYILRRPLELGGDDIQMEAVVAHFIEVVKVSDTSTVMILEPTAPLRTPADIEMALRLLDSSEADAVRVVAKMGAGCHPVQYRDAGLASAVRVDTFKRTGCLFPAGTVLLHLGDERAIDVDTQADLEAARALVGN